MKEIVPAPPPLVRNDTASVQALFAENVVPSYGRFDLVLSHGSGSYVWDVAGKRYLDMGGGIAVCALGHAPAAITEAMIEQSRRLVHVSNLYYNEPQGRLAQKLVSFIAPGKVFFCNSGAEANEGLYKLARKFGHDEGRFEVLTAFNSFHGRTLAGIAATGQDKVRKGFEPIMPGFRQVPYNDLDAVEKAISPTTAAILIEGIQGEGGVTPATVDFLLGLRKLCNERKMLLLMDAVQDGHFRTGRFQAFQRILEGAPGAAGFLPDGISMAKSLGGGFPMGAFWIRQPYADLLGAGTHGTTFGGTPLACTVALKVLEVIEQEKLADNARNLGEFLKQGFLGLRAKYPALIKDVRGLGLMIGVELQPEIKTLPGDPAKMQAIRLVVQLQHAGMLTVPSGAQVIRFLPPLNLQPAQAQEALNIFDKVLGSLASAH
jgi:acetylornithine aminotransferase/acetylornithine/N-succinyldiaminopimelate aminotransferase